MSGRPGKDQSKAPDFGRICVNLTSASKNSPRLTRLTRVHASTLHSAVTTRWRLRKKLVKCYCQRCEFTASTRALTCEDPFTPQSCSRVRKVTAALTIVIAFAIAGCGLFGSSEAVKQDPGRTLYRASEAPPDLSDVAPVKQEVPGEKRSRVP